MLEPLFLIDKCLRCNLLQVYNCSMNMCVCLLASQSVSAHLCVRWCELWKQLFRCWADYWISFFRRATPTQHPHPHYHCHHPLSVSAVLQGSLQMTECFCPALWNPCHIPFRRTAQQQRSLHVLEQIGKKHRQNFGGKRSHFVPSGFML